MSDRCKDCGEVIGPTTGCRRSTRDCQKDKWPESTRDRLRKVLAEAPEDEEDILMMLNDMIC